MFIDADGDGKTYVELQVNAEGRDLRLVPAGLSPEPERLGLGHEGGRSRSTARSTSATTRTRAGPSSWRFRSRPCKGKEKEMKNVPPKVGTEWRVNFFRMDMPNGRPQSGTGWSPPMVGDFHALDKFGVLVFGDDKGHAPNAAAPAKGEPKKAEATTPEKKGEEKKSEAAKKEEPKKEESTPAKNVKAAAKTAFNPPSQ